MPKSAMGRQMPKASALKTKYPIKVPKIYFLRCLSWFA